MPDVKVTARGHVQRRRAIRGTSAGIGLSDGVSRPGFSLIDLLVSITVIAILIGLLLPSLSLVRETTRRVICSSNVRQIGLALAMYSDDYRGGLPATKFMPESSGQSSFATPPQAQNVMLARLGSPDFMWDGVGRLYELDYLDHYGVLYCPSHHGDHPISRYAPSWGTGQGELFINFQYRAVGSLANVSNGAALVSDGLRTADDYNHFIGANVLRADFSAFWFSDPSGLVASRLPRESGDSDASNKVEDVWNTFDSQR